MLDNYFCLVDCRFLFTLEHFHTHHDSKHELQQFINAMSAEFQSLTVVNIHQCLLPQVGNKNVRNWKQPECHVLKITLHEFEEMTSKLFQHRDRDAIADAHEVIPSMPMFQIVCVVISFQFFGFFSNSSYIFLFFCSDFSFCFPFFGIDSAS